MRSEPMKTYIIQYKRHPLDYLCSMRVFADSRANAIVCVKAQEGERIIIVCVALAK